MADVIKDSDLTVVILNDIEEAALAALLSDYIDFHEDNIVEDADEADASILISLYEKLHGRGNE